jgi:predicted nucleotidyltransferase
MNEIDEKKNTLIEILRKHEVKRASLFGSAVTGETTGDSDIDLLVEFQGNKNLLDLVRLKIEFEEVLGKKVDILTYKSLHPLLREKILDEQEKIL